jgi:ferredoxin
MSTTHLRAAYQRALVLAQLAEDRKVLGDVIRTGWVGIAETKTLCVSCGDDLDVGQTYEKIYFTNRPKWERFVHETCPTRQEVIDELRRGQHTDLVMHSFICKGSGRCERCGTRFLKNQQVFEVRPFGDFPLEGKIYQRCCKECVSVYRGSPADPDRA